VYICLEKCWQILATCLGCQKRNSATYLLSKDDSGGDLRSPCRTWRQMRNYLLALFLSQGVPVLTMGDEYGHSKNGNLDVEDR
jgi:hypothetical protein